MATSSYGSGAAVKTTRWRVPRTVYSSASVEGKSDEASREERYAERGGRVRLRMNDSAQMRSLYSFSQGKS